jgi:hypothetical protein
LLPRKEIMLTELLLHRLRNSYGQSADELRETRLIAAKKIEELQKAYLDIAERDGSPEKENESQNILRNLRNARKEVGKQMKLISDEMIERGAKGQLWTNRQCRVWAEYESAVEELDLLRNLYGV